MKEKSPIRWPQSLLILAVCLAVTGCRTPGKKAAMQPLSPPPSKTEASSTHHGQNDFDSKKSEQPGRPHEAKPGNASLPVTAAPSNQQPTASLRPPGAQDNKPVAINGNTNLNNAGNSLPLPRPVPGVPQTAPDASSSVKLPVPDRNQSVPGAKTNLLSRPIPSAILLPGDSGVARLPVNASAVWTDGVPGKAFSIDLWQPLTSSNRRAVTAALLPDSGAAQTSINHFANGVAWTLAEGGSYNALPSNAAPAAVLPVRPLLKDIKTETERRERQVSQQEAERKARETERDNLNRALYRFLLGK